MKILAERLPVRWPLWVVLSAAACFRLFPLFSYQFTYDELSALQRVDFDNLADLVKYGIRIDAHPALLQFLVYFITRFTFATWVFKLPFILLSLGSICYGYAFVARFGNRTGASVAALLLAFSLPFVYHAPIARMYCSGVFFSLATLFHFAEITWHRNTGTKHYILFGAFMLLGALNHHMNALYASTVYVAGLVMIKKDQLKTYLLTGLFTVLIYSVHLPVTLYQLNIKGIGVEQGGWLEPPRYTALPEFLYVLFGTGPGLGAAGICVVAALWLAFKAIRWRLVLWLLSLFLVNFFVIYLYSVIRAPVYQHSVMLFAGTGLVLMVGVFAGHVPGKAGYALALGFGLLLIRQTYFVKQYFAQCVSNVYEYQYGRTGRLDSAPLALFYDTDSVMNRLYCAKYLCNYKRVLNPGDSSLLSLASLLQKEEAGICVLASSSPLVQALVKDKYPYLVQNTHTQGVHYKMYARKQQGDTVADDNVLFHQSFLESGFFSTSPAVKSGFEVRGDEFPLLMEAMVSDLPVREGMVLLVQCDVSDSQPESLELCMAVTDSTNTNIRHYTATRAADFLYDGENRRMYCQLFFGNFLQDVKPGDRLRIYLWNRGSDVFFLRSLQVKLIDHWPEKWNFWK